MWRLRMWLEKVGWKPVALGVAIVVVVIVAAVGAYALLLGGD